MKTRIIEKIKEIEYSHNVEVLFAIESGSRAWGFASPDSDYDIRFVYKHSKEWYLNLWEPKDTIQFMTHDDLDGSGWDIRKMLRLLGKSNASLLGWVYSPICYWNTNSFLEELKVVADASFNPVAIFYHYHSMNKNFANQLHTEALTLKAFFYALRTALCANWVIKKESVPPVLFTDLFELVPNEYLDDLYSLIAIKANEVEKSTVAIPKLLIQLAESIITENELKKNGLKNSKAPAKLLNNFFLKHV